MRSATIPIVVFIAACTFDPSEGSTGSSTTTEAASTGGSSTIASTTSDETETLSTTSAGSSVTTSGSTDSTTTQATSSTTTDDTTDGSTGTGIVCPPEAKCDPKDPPFPEAVCTEDCELDFTSAVQLYCNGTCSVAGPEDCDQADADVFCKLLTRSPTAHAVEFLVYDTEVGPGFGCEGGVLVGPFPEWGVDLQLHWSPIDLPPGHSGSAILVDVLECAP